MTELFTAMTDAFDTRNSIGEQPLCTGEGLGGRVLCLQESLSVCSRCGSCRHCRTVQASALSPVRAFSICSAMRAWRQWWCTPPASQHLPTPLQCGLLLLQLRYSL